jgi:hypothetical protein
MTPFAQRSLRLLLRVACLIGSVWWVGACGSSQPSRLPGTEITGDVVERAEGYAERPDWADPNQPWSRHGDTVRVTGYVAIRGDQRKEAGYRAADSYARAELVRFLSVRVVSVLEDQVKTGESPVLRERIEETAQSWVDSLTIAQRYFERRKSSNADKLHIFSRLDVDQATVAELLQRATQSGSELRTPTAELLAKFNQRWEQFAEVGSLNQGDTLLPVGVIAPPWAKSGDKVDSVQFQFVCSGLGKDEKTARAVAQARCSEKLCRLFGVQITAKSKVVENLDGVTAESEVSERCADVRVVGRETRYQSAECGPQGCVQWLQQTYPRTAYEEEKQRLDKPTVIRQQVVIQEGDKFYRDPAACESSLRAYSNIQGWEAAAFVKRKQHLQQAMKVCQGIDGRESGLFLTLNNLLTNALANFTTLPPNRGYNEDFNVSPQRLFSLASTEWRQNLDTQRFLTDRITSVLTLVNAAIVPLRLLELRDEGGSTAEAEAVFREVVKYPFVTAKASPHHYYYLHDLALSLARSKRAPYSPRYRDYLMTQAESGRYACSSKTQIPGASILSYLAADGTLDDREWRIGVQMIRNGDEYGPDDCVDVMWNKKVNHGPLRSQRLDQTAQLLVSGESHAKDVAAAFQNLLRELPEEERLPTFQRFRSKITGSQRYQENVASDVVRSAFKYDWEWERSKRAEGIQQCTLMPSRIGNLFSEVPTAKAKETGLCLCLKLDGLSASTRKAIVNLLFQYTEERCDWIKPEDWPEPYYSAAEPPYRPVPDGPRPFRGIPKFLGAEFQRCLDQHLTIERETVESYVTATHNAGRFSDVNVNATIVGELSKFEYRDKRRGLVKKGDIDTIKRNLENCMRNAVTTFQVPSVWLKPDETYPRRVWFQFWDGNQGNSGYVK